jgi:integrase/recombinase XerD
MGKNNRKGQAAILSDREYLAIKREIKSKKYKLLWDIAWYTGERWGAIVQLKFDDLYFGEKPLDYITFAATTRKASPDGKRQTRQVPIHAALRESLADYKPEYFNGYIFPGKADDSHIALRLADKILRAAIQRAGLEAKGISTHSTRRTFITKLHQKGVDIYTIKTITGHSDLKSLARYIEHDDDRIIGAINLL